MCTPWSQVAACLDPSINQLTVPLKYVAPWKRVQLNHKYDKLRQVPRWVTPITVVIKSFSTLFLFVTVMFMANCGLHLNIKNGLNKYTNLLHLCCSETSDLCAVAFKLQIGLKHNRLIVSFDSEKTLLETGISLDVIYLL